MGNNPHKHFTAPLNSNPFLSWKASHQPENNPNDTVAPSVLIGGRETSIYQSVLSGPDEFSVAEAHLHWGKHRRAGGEAEGSVRKLPKVGGGIPGSCVAYQGCCHQRVALSSEQWKKCSARCCCILIPNHRRSKFLLWSRWFILYLPNSKWIAAQQGNQTPEYCNEVQIMGANLCVSWLLFLSLR